MIPNQNINLVTERDYELSIALKESDGTTELDLHGCSISWALSKVYGEVALILKTSAEITEIQVTDEPGGLLTVYIDAADTALLGGSEYKHEMIIVDAQGNTSTVLTGSATITKGIDMEPEPEPVVP